ncbi:MAG TPA: hypothetical protein VGN72_19285 [Tepidisphaeraceae bacterium]|jgi:type II secretory pathway pseudopilin PulG|nr:hypothetical protein [Tepidisphaeraceae bacterium]
MVTRRDRCPFYAATSAGRVRVRRSAFTLVEMLVVVCVLIIVLGLMVNLARSVRVGYATDITKDILRKLDDAVTQYQQRTGQLPDVPPLIPASGPIDENRLRQNAIGNNKQIVLALLGTDLPMTVINDQPATIYNKGQLRDPWGTPIVYMPRFDPQIGMALRDRPFFVSAGPDMKFLTLEDNFYSYEGIIAPEPVDPSTRPASPVLEQ